MIYSNFHMVLIIPLFYLLLVLFLIYVKIPIKEIYCSIQFFLSFSHHSFESEENTIYLSNLIFRGVMKEGKVHKHLSSACYEPGSLCVLHAFCLFVLILANLIGFSGIIPVSQMQKLKDKSHRAFKWLSQNSNSVFQNVLFFILYLVVILVWDEVSVYDLLGALKKNKMF